MSSRDTTHPVQSRLTTYRASLPHTSSIPPSSPIMAAQALNQVYRFAIPTAVAFSVASASIYDVRGGQRAVIFDRLNGVKEGVVNEGTHFLVPWLQRAIMYDVRTKPRNISTTTGSKDLQMVSLTLRVLHRPEVGMLPKIYQVCHIHINIYRSSLAMALHPAYSRIIQPESPPQPVLTHHSSPLVKTTTSVSSPPSATKSSNPSSRNSTPPN